MGLSIRTKNILTAVIALVLVGGFIFLAEGRKKDNKDDRLEAIEGLTTTTVRRTTTTRPETTTSSSALVTTSTSSSPAVTTATTVRTATTRPAGTGTTRPPKPPKTTTTAGPTGAPVPQNGPRAEASDNGNSFTRNGDGSFATATAPACNDKERIDPFCFHVGSEGNLSFVVVLRNNTDRTLTFPTQDRLMRLVVNVQRPNGTTQQFSLDTRKLGTEIKPHEGIRITTEGSQQLAGQFSDVGQYTFTASCEVDYGT